MDTIFNVQQKKLLVTLSLLFLFVLNVNSIFAQDGEKLYKQNCAVCHSLGKNKLTGPGLEGVASRVPQPADEWLLKWIKNNVAVTKSGDAYAKKLMDEYKGAQMTVFTDLSDDEIKAIIEYFKNPPVEKQAEVAGPTSSQGQEQGVDPFGILLGVIAFLVIVIAVLRGVRYSLKNLVNEKQGLPQEEQKGPLHEIWLWMDQNRTKSAVIIILIVLCLSASAWYALKEIGIYEGYHPEQPIAFSHKIHAGDNAIDCQYCHSGVEKSKTAGIPTVNVCMNCHKGISKGPSGEKGTAEIAKIYDAAGWDPEEGEYTKPQKPIKWVKVHNLPDFVFFSHQQHVKVGKQDCTNCHGDVKEMTTAKQDQSLTMGWCIDCHKKTEVPGMKDNPYYASLHKKLAEKYKNQPITVDKMGGIECAKCHY